MEAIEYLKVWEKLALGQIEPAQAKAAFNRIGAELSRRSDAYRLQSERDRPAHRTAYGAPMTVLELIEHLKNLDPLAEVIVMEGPNDHCLCNADKPFMRDDGRVEIPGA